MWQISFMIVPVVVGAIIPIVFYSALMEVGKPKKGKYICRWPKVFRIIFFSGVLLFSFLLLMCCLTIEEWRVGEIVLIVLGIILIIIFACPCYVFLKHKIIIDTEKEEILVYRFFAPKKRVAFSSIYYKDDEKKAIIFVRDSEKKKLFGYTNVMAGCSELSNCLSVIIKNNQKHEPIDLKEIMRLINRAQELLL